VNGKVVKINKARAIKILENNVHNRRVRDRVVKVYARDMREGRWKFTHQGIAFDEDGTLIDGQHRLWAIVEADVTIPMVIYEGLSKDAQMVIDTHVIRDTVDCLDLSDEFGTVTVLEVQILRRLLCGVSERGHGAIKLSRMEEAEEFRRHREAIQFAIAQFPQRRRRITSAAVYAVIARASYQKGDHYKPLSTKIYAYGSLLNRFCYVLYSSEQQRARERPIIALRDKLLQPTREGKFLPPSMIYRYTEAALCAFLEDAPRRALRPVTRERFPIMGDKIQRVGAKKLNFDTVDRVMEVMRTEKRASMAQIRKLTKVNSTSCRRAVKTCEELGWLVDTGEFEGKGGHASAVYRVRRSKG
jgi:hypothetical protein